MALPLPLQQLPFTCKSCRTKERNSVVGQLVLGHYPLGHNPSGQDPSRQNPVQREKNSTGHNPQDKIPLRQNFKGIEKNIPPGLTESHIGCCTE